MAFTDLHVHLLPAVDDGSRDHLQSLTHARLMAEDGVAEAVLTPHVGHPSFPLDVGGIAACAAALRGVLERARVHLRLHVGGEIHPRAASDLGARELDAIAQGPPGARWVLLEAPFKGIDADFLSACSSLRRRGLGVMIAHPERSAGFLPHGLDDLAGELSAGTLLQVSVCSLAGDHGSAVRRAAEELVVSGRASVIASDGHPRSRRHTLRDGHRLALGAGATARRAWELTTGNPELLLSRGLVPAPVGRPWRAEPVDRLAAARAAARRLPSR
jgi:protein-tyrosine phosphatase